MRHLLRTLAAALLGVLAPMALTAQVSTVALPGDSTADAMRALRIEEGRLELNGRFVRGNHEVGVGDTVRGPLVVVLGNADVRGVVLGDVSVIFGDVTVRDGADVRGGATAWRGRVVVEGGRVRGALRVAPVATAARVDAPPMTRGEMLRLAGGWLAMLLIIGFVALVLASRNLDETARVLERDFGKAFLVGVAGQLGFLPLLILGIVALCVTVLGILLVPFVLVAAPIALGGLITLGWLAMALMLGHALLRGSARDDRASMVRALVPGTVLLMAPWAIAALMQGPSTSALLVRTAAIGITWVAATAGLGAALLVRAGAGSRRSETPMAPSSAGWQTPTPVAGIASARRPIPARPGATPK
jgi:hypothetical protein